MRRTSIPVIAASILAAGTLAGSGMASAGSQASCTGQFFSSHAGLRPATGENVGGFISPTARELGRDFGQTIAAARELPREACGL